MKKRWNRHAVAKLALLFMILASVLTVVLRPQPEQPGPSIELIGTDDSTRTYSLSQLKDLKVLEREGTYQNQYGNWRDHGLYAGVLLQDLVQSTEYTQLEIEAADGYRLAIERARVIDEKHPIVLAFSMDGVEVPDWEDGFRVAVLPDDGDISNEEYETTSAGSFWVKNVIRIRAIP